MLNRLHQVGRDRVFHKRRHRALRMQVAGRYRLTVIIVGDDNAAEPFFHIFEIMRKTQNRHDFGRDRNIKAVFARHAVHFAAQTDHDMAQCPIIHIDHAFPHDPTRINAQRIALLQMVIEHGRQ